MKFNIFWPTAPLPDFDEEIEKVTLREEIFAWGNFRGKKFFFANGWVKNSEFRGRNFRELANFIDFAEFNFSNGPQDIVFFLLPSLELFIYE